MSDQQTQARITITPNGPYLVTGGIPLTERYVAESVHGEPLEWDPVGAKGDVPIVQEKYALCRRVPPGAYAHRPFLWWHPRPRRLRGHAHRPPGAERDATSDIRGARRHADR